MRGGHLRDTQLRPRIDRQTKPSETHPVPTVLPEMILIIDDDKSNRTIARLFLRREGFAVMEADGAEEGLAVYRRFQDTIAVVLISVQMNDIDGPSTMVALRHLNPNVCCCFMWDYLGSYSAEELSSMGVVTTFTKPLVLREMANRLWELMDRVRSAHQFAGEGRGR